MPHIQGLGMFLCMSLRSLAPETPCVTQVSEQHGKTVWDGPNELKVSTRNTLNPIKAF